MIKYSNKFMERFGEDVHKAKLDIGFIRKSFYWIINSKYRRSVKLAQWLNEQVEIPDHRLVHIANNLKGKDNDETIIDILRFVHRSVRYTPDQEQWGMPEYWQTATETLASNEGDCEDMSILIYVLARLAGIPAFQITIACGDVKVNNGTEGHAYIIYSADLDGVDRFIDSCYYYDYRSVRLRKTEDNRYVNEWFRFNEKNSYIKRRK